MPFQKVHKKLLPLIQQVSNSKPFILSRTVVNKAFTKHLLLTNISVSMTLSGLGDVCQQQYQIKSGQKISHSVLRTIHMTTTGLSIGALCHYWYQFLDRVLPGRTGKVIVRKLLVDQIIFSPICLASFFITLLLCRKISNYMFHAISHNKLDNNNVTIENNRFISIPHNNFNNNTINKSYLMESSQINEDDFNTFLEEFKNKGLLLYLSEWVIWPPAQLINFYYLPTRYRVLYDNTVGLVYDIYTSHVCYDMDLKVAAHILQSQNNMTDNNSINFNRTIIKSIRPVALQSE